jgi:hypothetical protein
MLPVPASARALRSPMVMVLPVLGRATSVARSGTDFARAHGRSTPVAIEDQRNLARRITPSAGEAPGVAAPTGPRPSPGWPPDLGMDSHGRTDHPKARLRDQG